MKLEYWILITADKRAAQITHAFQIFVCPGITSLWKRINSHLQANYLLSRLLYACKNTLNPWAALFISTTLTCNKGAQLRTLQCKHTADTGPVVESEVTARLISWRVLFPSVAECHCLDLCRTRTYCYWFSNILTCLYWILSENVKWNFQFLAWEIQT